MSSPRQLSELLIQWEEQHEKGQPVSVEDLCRDCPELADELRRKVEILQAMEHLAPVGPLTDSCGEATRDFPADPPTSPGTTLIPQRGAPAVPLPSIPGYEIMRVVGRGGMGVVFQARQTSLNRIVALKMILAGPYASTEQRKRFRIEAEAAARLQHPNIVQIHEVGETEGHPYCVLEYVAGGSLVDQLEGTPWLPREAAQLVAMVADGVQAAHARGIIHRDLKPANILLTSGASEPSATTGQDAGAQHGQRSTDRGPIAKITDFGLAKRLDDAAHQTQSGVVMGTPSYMAPEQAAGRSSAIGPATDIWSLGAILYELLTGRPPFCGAATMDTLQQVLTAEPVPPRRIQPLVPHDLETICLSCLRKVPGERYASAGALAGDLRRFLRGEPILARPTSLGERTWKWARRRPAVAGLLALSSAAILTLTVLSLVYNVQLKRERDAADRERVRAELGEEQARLEKEESDRLRQQAEANFQFARHAVDRVTAKLTEDDNRRAEDLRKELLGLTAQLYQDFVKQRGDDPGLRAANGRAYLRLAQITGELGSKETEAIPLYERAQSIFEQLQRDDPKNLGVQRDLAQVDYYLGKTYLDISRPSPAEEALNQALTIQKKLVEQEPAVASHRSDLARTLYALGEVSFDLHPRNPRAERAYREALALFDSLAAKQPLEPGDVQLMGNIWQSLGRYYIYQGSERFPDSQKAFEQAMALRQQLVKEHPGVVGYRSDLASSYYGLGALHWNLGEPNKARAAHHEARRIREQLVREHPTVTRFAVDLGTSYRALGLQSISPEAKVKWSSEAIKTLEGVLEKEPRHGEARTHLWEAYLRRGMNLNHLGRYPEAVEDLQRADQLHQGPSWQSHYGRAVALAHLGRYQQAGDEADKVDGRKFVADRHYELARAYSLCAKGATQDSAMSAPERNKLTSRYSSRAVRQLSRAREAGWFKEPDAVLSLKMDPDFEPLRGRKDYQKLLGELK